MLDAWGYTTSFPVLAKNGLTVLNVWARRVPDKLKGVGNASACKQY